MGEDLSKFIELFRVGIEHNDNIYNAFNNCVNNLFPFPNEYEIVDRIRYEYNDFRIKCEEVKISLHMILYKYSDTFYMSEDYLKEGKEFIDKSKELLCVIDNNMITIYEACCKFKTINRLAELFDAWEKILEKLKYLVMDFIYRYESRYNKEKDLLKKQKDDISKLKF